MPEEKTVKHDGADFYVNMWNVNSSLVGHSLITCSQPMQWQVLSMFMVLQVYSVALV
jgi:hypothetical protein